MPTMLATFFASAAASLAPALRFLADGRAAIAYANNVDDTDVLEPATRAGLGPMHTFYATGQCKSRG